MSATVAEVMTKDVTGVRGSASFKEIAARLRQLRVSALPVLDDDDRVIGVVSEADLLPKEALEAGHEGHSGLLSGVLRRRELQKAEGVTAAGLMSRPPVTVGPDDLVSHAAHLMYGRRIKHIPVVGEDGRLAGIISRADVLSVFSRPDEEIRREICEKIILGEFLIDPATFAVTVTDGIVTLEGHPGTPALVHDIASQVRHMEGVIAVHDRAAYPPAESAPAAGRRF